MESRTACVFGNVNLRRRDASASLVREFKEHQLTVTLFFLKKNALYLMNENYTAPTLVPDLRRSRKDAFVRLATKSEGNKKEKEE